MINMQNPKYFAIPHQPAFYYPRTYHSNQGLTSAGIATLVCCSLLAFYEIFLVVFNVEGVIDSYKRPSTYVIIFTIYFFVNAFLRIMGVVSGIVAGIKGSKSFGYGYLWIPLAISLLFSGLILIPIWGKVPLGVYQSIATGSILCIAVIISSYFLNSRQPQYMIVPNY
jgi:hypothetical protein